jgi:mannose-6-phosphate isomerase class I
MHQHLPAIEAAAESSLAVAISLPSARQRSQVLSATEPAHRGSTRQDSWFNRQCSFLTHPFKVLDVAQMLLIQANPTKKQAEEGFARENAAGIDLRASERNYKGDSDKPEVAVALTEFWMLHGFRSLEQIAEIGGARCAPASQKKRRLRFSGFKQQHEVDSVLLRGAQARS